MVDPLVAFVAVGLAVGGAGAMSAFAREAFANPLVVAARRVVGGLIGSVLGAALATWLFGLDENEAHPVALAAGALGAAFAPALLGLWGFPQGVADVEKLRRRGDVLRLGNVLLYPTGPHGERDDLAAAAARALGALGDSAAGEPLVEAALTSPWEPVRRAALDELRRARWPGAADGLRRRVAADDPQTARRASAALAALGVAGAAAEIEVPSARESETRIRRLPVGHAPGPQTLQVPAEPEDDVELGVASTIAVGLMFLLYLLLAVRFIGQGEIEIFGGGLTDYLVGVGLSIPIAALFFAAVAVERIGVRRVAIVPDQRPCRRGEDVRVRLSLPHTGRRDQVRLMLRCTEYYNGVIESDPLGPVGVVLNAARERAGILKITVWESEQSLPLASGAKAASVRLPPDGPFSYEGDVLSLAWQVGVRVDRRWRASPVAWEPIWVLP
jgi:hypothetical protein